MSFFPAVARALRGRLAGHAFAVCTVGLSIGAATAAYSAVRSIIAAPPLLQIERIANVYRTDPRLNPSIPAIAFSTTEIARISGASAVFDLVATWAPFRAALRASDRSETVWGEAVNADYFRLFAAAPIAGRRLLPADDAPGAPAVAVISEQLWRDRFAGLPDALGRTVVIGQHRFEVVGVMPSDFRGLFNPSFIAKGVWIPLAQASLVNEGDSPGEPDRKWILVKARLRHGRTFDEAQAWVSATAAIRDAEVASSARRSSPPAWRVRPAASVSVNEAADALVIPIATAVLVAVLLTLMVACTNLANLQLAWGRPRRRAIAIEYALGASRRRVLVHELGSAAVVALAGGSLGWAIAHTITAAWLTGTVYIAPGVSMAFSPRLDGGAVLMCAACTAIAFATAGVFPAVSLSRVSVSELLTVGDGDTVSSWKWRRNVIASQVAVSIALFAVGASCVQELLSARRALGDLDPARLTFIRLETQPAPAGRSTRNVESVLEVLTSRPDVEAAAALSSLPSVPTTPLVYLGHHGQGPIFNGRVVGVAAQNIECTPNARDVMRLQLLGWAGGS